MHPNSWKQPRPWAAAAREVPLMHSRLHASSISGVFWKDRPTDTSEEVKTASQLFAREDNAATITRE